MASSLPLAYADTFCGLVPVRVLGVTPPRWAVDGPNPCPPEPTRGGRASVAVKVTATTGPYGRGEVLVFAPAYVVDRERITTRSGQLRIRPVCPNGDSRCARRAGHHGACHPLTVDRVNRAGEVVV